jgi:hypothetical protein
MPIIFQGQNVTTGATGTTMVAPKFSDILTLYQPGWANSAHHRRCCTKIFPMDSSLYSICTTNWLNELRIEERSSETKHLGFKVALKFFKIKVMTHFIYRISANSVRRNYSFLKGQDVTQLFMFSWIEEGENKNIFVMEIF